MVSGYLLEGVKSDYKGKDEIHGKIRKWHTTLSGISPHICCTPVLIEDLMMQGTVKFVLLAGLPGISDNHHGYYAYMFDRDEVITAVCCDNLPEITKLVGFYDNKNRYVGHAYVSDAEYENLLNIMKEV